jgi:hypothetical protein
MYIIISSLTQAMDGTGAYMVRWTFKLIIILYLYSTHYIDQWAMDKVHQQEQAQQGEGDAIN